MRGWFPGRAEARWAAPPAHARGHWEGSWLVRNLISGLRTRRAVLGDAPDVGRWRSRAAKLERRWRRRREAGAEAGAGAVRPVGPQAAAVTRGPSPEAGAAVMAESIVSAAAGRERGAGMRQQICRRPGRAARDVLGARPRLLAVLA